MKIRKWDKVIIVSWSWKFKASDEEWKKWKDRWKTWKVLKVFKDKDRVIVEWIKIITKHIKKSWTEPWRIIKIEAPIHVSNVVLVCPFTQKPTKIWFVVIDNKNGGKKKFRYSKTALNDKGWKPKDFIID